MRGKAHVLVLAITLRRGRPHGMMIGVTLSAKESFLLGLDEIANRAAAGGEEVGERFAFEVESLAELGPFEELEDP